MRNLIKTFLVMLMLSFSHAAIAGDYEDGLAAGEKGDFATALRLWTPLAEQGDADAQNNLGLMYDKGQGVAQDYKTAVKWYTLAAEQGNAKVQTILGVMYAQGQGVSQDYKTAVKWYTLAAEQGVAQAQYLLGMMYHLGQGVVQDYVKANMWYNIASIDGDADAIKNRDDVAKLMTPAQIAEAQKAASRCIKQNFKNCD
jgi:TPR repeat protein